ncbi:TetR/AcrR family transcriptional regulator [Williamsia serinedens]|uniref:Transcriptional regulator, TetR family n=1 Tax=Williamsia serinedens TaxID=391736 RepID=A0ABT1H704_9NOCA|nr:TetR/AcrR family transcriptional regulator [Williamsia serinedens]MCP2163005.1 transcriptional regulator, TetR family [Williamsia serinedens]
MDYRHQNRGRSAPGAVTLTAKGRRTRERIVAAAARLIWERGIAATTLDDVKAAADVSSSQLYHYFTDKEGLVAAVVEYQADRLVEATTEADLSSVDNLLSWRDTVVGHAREVNAAGGCPLGALGSQIAETDPRARTLAAAGFGRWSGAIRDGLRRMSDEGHLLPGVDPDAVAITLLAALQGGLLIAQVHRDVEPLRTSLRTILELVGVTDKPG